MFGEKIKHSRGLIIVEDTYTIAVLISIYFTKTVKPK